MHIDQRGTARDGQHGVITEVYPNAVRFLSDTGAHFTLLNCEFTPRSATPAERKAIAKAAQGTLGHIGPNHGFHYRIKHRGGKLIELMVKRIPRYLGIPDGEPTPEPEAV